MKVVVIGGGPAGMIAAITAKEQGNDVILLEKMKTLGRKLLITGKGRCNITSSLDMDEFIKNIPGNGRFLYSAFQQYTNQDIIAFLKKKKVEVKEERGNRIFPVSDKSIDVLQAFESRLRELKVEIRTNTEVTKILTEEGKVSGIEYISKEDKQKESIQADKVILATGGMSYPSTGSNGDGYQMLKKLGHTITEIKPSLVPLEIQEKRICKELQGLSLRNVAIKVIDKEKDKLIYEDFGEMLFTHYGVSGPIIISSSAHLVRYKKMDYLLQEGKVQLQIDFKPALTKEKLDLRIQRDFEELKNKQFKNSLDKLLPQKLIPVMVERVGINPYKQVNQITKEERGKLVEILKHFTLTISDFRSMEEAIITAGGVNIKEINPSTMESKLIKGLYVAGEIIDVDAYTGGFNLQIAYSTGYVAGSNL